MHSPQPPLLPPCHMGGVRVEQLGLRGDPYPPADAVCANDSRE